MDFLNKNKYFNENQFGLRSGRNTTDALMRFMEPVHGWSKRWTVYCAGLFIHVMKAFDTVDHVLLLQKLHVAGVRGIPNKWFASSD